MRWAEMSDLGTDITCDLMSGITYIGTLFLADWTGWTVIYWNYVEIFRGTAEDARVEYATILQENPETWLMERLL